jgi:hypothetical protein
MRCPRCKGSRIQRDYDDAILLVRLIGLHRLLCNNCGLVFKWFDPLGKLQRAPSKSKTPGITRNRRRGPRYQAHLPSAISLIEGNVKAGKVSYSEPSRGHCESISKFGMSLSLVGTRFPERDLSRIGRLLFVRVVLPDEAIEAVVSIINHEKIGEELKRKWLLGVNIQQMSDDDTAKLAAYLEKRAQGEPVIISE